MERRFIHPYFIDSSIYVTYVVELGQFAFNASQAETKKECCCWY